MVHVIFAYGHISLALTRISPSLSLLNGYRPLISLEGRKGGKPDAIRSCKTTFTGMGGYPVHFSKTNNRSFLHFPPKQVDAKTNSVGVINILFRLRELSEYQGKVELKSLSLPLPVWNRNSLAQFSFCAAFLTCRVIFGLTPPLQPTTSLISRQKNSRYSAADFLPF